MSDETGAPKSDAYRCYEQADEHAFPDERLHRIIDAIAADEEIQALLQVQNVNPVTRLGYNDHGPKHIEIVTDRALCLYDLLKRGDVTFRGAGDQGLSEADEPVIIALAATLHDVGNLVHRYRHAEWSISLAADVLDRFLEPFYDIPERCKMKAEILHAIVCHHAEQSPLTEEAGVMRIADGLDMEHGRSRQPYERGGRGINTVSSQAIKRVNLYEGQSAPVRVEIEMTNAAGVYQVDSLLKAKLEGSGLEEEVRIVAVNVGQSGDRIVERLEL